MQLTNIIPKSILIFTAIVSTLAKASASSATEMGEPGSSLPTDTPIWSPDDNESGDDQSASSSSKRPDLRVLPGGLSGQRRPTISISLDAYMPKRPEHITVDAIAQIPELDRFDYQSLDGTDAAEYAEVEQRPGFWSGSTGWEALWRVASRYMEVPDSINDKLLFESCILEKLGLKRDETTLQYWLAQTSDPEDKAMLKSFTILCIAEINAYNAQDLMPEEWLALLASWNI